jgi:aconitate hydratase
VDGKSYSYFSLPEAAKQIGDVSRLPFSLKVLLENVLRFENGRSYTVEDARAIAAWVEKGHSEREVPFRPARILMQDFTGVPAVVDLAAMRDGILRPGRRAQTGEPAGPGGPGHRPLGDGGRLRHAHALQQNVDIEFDRNGERYEFLRWGQSAFDNFRVVPPGTGICHQVNLEYLAQVVWTAAGRRRHLRLPGQLLRHGQPHDDGERPRRARLGRGRHRGGGGHARPADRHADPGRDRLPLTGRLREGVTRPTWADRHADAAAEGRGPKFVEFFGPGLATGRSRTAHHRQHGAEYGATCGFFRWTRSRWANLRLSGREEHRISLVREYCRAQGGPGARRLHAGTPVFTRPRWSSYLSTVESLARRPRRRPPDRRGRCPTSHPPSPGTLAAGAWACRGTEARSARRSRAPTTTSATGIL